jgi:hypothetical protein
MPVVRCCEHAVAGELRITVQVFVRPRMFSMVKLSTL